MSWIILLLGGIGGGVLSAYSRKNRDSVLLRIVSSLVPFGATALFFFLKYKSGGLGALAGTLVPSGSLASGAVSFIITTVICVGISKGLGALIVYYIESK